jgi:hypothetical protein
MREPTKKTYTITPKLTKSLYEEETWSNTLKSGKRVEITIVSSYRWGEFGITLSSEEYETVKNQEEVVVSDYEYEFYHMDDCRCIDYIIENKSRYSEEELSEIDELGGLENGFDEDFFEDNDWLSSFPKYVIVDGCELVEEES